MDITLNTHILKWTMMIGTSFDRSQTQSECDDHILYVHDFKRIALQNTSN